MKNPCKQLCPLVLLVFLLVSCAPSLSPSAYPNPVTTPPNTVTATLHPIAVLLTEQILRTATPTAAPPVPPSEDFTKGDLAQVSLDEAQSLSEEDIVKLLMSRWLERYMKEEPSSPESITDYSIEKVEVKSRLSDMEVIVHIQFSVIPGRSSFSSWVPITVKFDEPWFRVAGYFSIFQDGEYYKLKFLPGWGS